MVKIFTAVRLCTWSFKREDDETLKQCGSAVEVKQETASHRPIPKRLAPHVLLPSLSFGNTAPVEHAASSPADRCSRISSGI